MYNMIKKNNDLIHALSTHISSGWENLFGKPVRIIFLCLDAPFVNHFIDALFCGPMYMLREELANMGVELVVGMGSRRKKNL